MAYELIHKPTFANQLLALPSNVMAQILKKIEVLREDPSPNPPAKKKLHGYQGNVYRLRMGDWRILYTYGQDAEGRSWVTLLKVDNRATVYEDEGVPAEGPDVALAGVPEADVALRSAARPQPAAVQTVVQTAVADPPPPSPPIQIDDDLLRRLRIPEIYFARLRACRTEDALQNADVPGPLLERVMDAVFEPDVSQVLQQPDYLTGEVDNLLRYREGELMGFLLRLSPEQEKFATWALNAAGPTLVKGGPGTGKSTVALYRVRSLLQALRAAGTEQPRILFTTYTNALIAYSRQLLETLIGEDVRFVEIRTADSLAMWIVQEDSWVPPLADRDELRQAMLEAIASAEFNGNTLQQAAQRKTVERLGYEYLIEEIGSVIEARQLATLAEYLAAPRTGRRHAFNATQRTAVWAVREAYVRELARMRRRTWEQARARAEEVVRAGGGPEPYDAVIVDEAQDLDPSVLRMLVELCRAPNRLFVTADANQSIYGSSFRWSDVHAQLQFRGRTGVLRANFRSTREIGEAAQSFLAEGALDDEQPEREYRHDGPLPVVRAVRSGGDECALLARFLPRAAREVRLGVGACAVLCPTEKAGKSIAATLVSLGLEASFMTGRELDLGRKGIKVLTLKSAKGLEFPVVALAGFPAKYPPLRADMPSEQREEVLARERRTLFVGMTRAMRALLVVVPEETSSTLLSGFDPAYWNMGD